MNGLVKAEDRLRAAGLTGAQAFEALLLALRARLGDDVVPTPVARAAAADLDPDVDLVGLAYERFFPDLFKGRRGQFFTPPPIVRLVLSRLAVAGASLLDPTCGSGGFLIAAGREGARLHGIELDPYLAQLAAINLRLAGLTGDVRRGDFFAAPPRPCDVVVANPPFSVEIRDREVLERYHLGRGRRRALSDVLFVEALEGWVRPGGRAGIVLPYSVLSGSGSARLRERIASHWRIEAICSLPEGVFRPFGGAAGRACVLWLERGPPTRADAPTVWGSLSDPGYDVRSVRLRHTGTEDLDRLCRGRGWRELPPGAWTPPAAGRRGRPLSSVARVRKAKVKAGSGPVRVIELADADKRTGEVVSSRTAPAAEVAGSKVGLCSGDVLVARMRPSLGNVAIAPASAEPLVGSTEWIPLEAAAGAHWILHVLRSAAWRSQLPATEGQTRPRTTAKAVLGTRIPWPDVAERVDLLSRQLHAERAALRDRLAALQVAVDAFAGGEIEEAELDAIVAALEGG